MKTQNSILKRAIDTYERTEISVNRGGGQGIKGKGDKNKKYNECTLSR